MRGRLAGTLVFALVLGLGAPRGAHAAPQVSRFNLVLSANPTSLEAKDFNETLQNYNRVVLAPKGLEGLDDIKFSWLFDAQLRYFVRPNVAISAGAGKLTSQSKREYLPGLEQDIQLRAEITSVQLHAGAAYYLAPYTQGDFQARAYVGAGFLSLVSHRGLFQAAELGTDPSTTLGGSYVLTGRRDSPGYYVEVGGHMFFPSKVSVMLGLLYRSAEATALEGELEIAGQRMPVGEVFDLDTSGVGARMGLAFGF